MARARAHQKRGRVRRAGLALPFLAALVMVPFRTDLSHTNAALVLVVVVVAVAALGSRLAGAAHEHSFLTRPYETFGISATADIETAVLLLAVVTVTDEGYLARIHTTADLVRSAKSADVVDHVRGELTGLLGLSGCRFEYGTLLGQPTRLGTTSAGSRSRRGPGRCRRGRRGWSR
ncbi:hypothetical protein [Streptomyces sp. NPDC056660]|uniref:hypothetical protein n=1 Tax=Streptomyces sp. NPDC056660 TaxID=3345897 RepID=UPI00368E4658